MDQLERLQRGAHRVLVAAADGVLEGLRELQRNRLQQAGEVLRVAVLDANQADDARRPVHGLKGTVAIQEVAQMRAERVTLGHQRLRNGLLESPHEVVMLRRAQHDRHHRQERGPGREKLLRKVRHAVLAHGLVEQQQRWHHRVLELCLCRPRRLALALGRLRVCGAEAYKNFLVGLVRHELRGDKGVRPQAHLAGIVERTRAVTTE
mmetsp:Transcript_90786/g.234430  ORF Transcript_90786/g.234430 Transcript_90786/m.234430 type:complete len:207 (+) Transcript_90786:193-813(+)